MSRSKRSGAGHSAAAKTGPNIGGIVIAVLIVAGLVWAGIALAPYVTRATIEEWIKSAGAWGPALLLVIQVAQILVAPIPGVFVPIVAGVFYGPVLGAAITAVGSCIGSAAAYWIGRTGGRKIAERLIGPEPLNKASKLIGGRRWLGLIPLMLFPLSPADALCFTAGIIGMKWERFCIAVAAGRLPKDVVVAVGAGLGWGALR